MTDGSSPCRAWANTGRWTREDWPVELLGVSQEDVTTKRNHDKSSHSGIPMLGLGNGTELRIAPTEVDKTTPLLARPG